MAGEKSVRRGRSQMQRLGICRPQFRIRPVRFLSIAGGAFGEGYLEAAALGAQAYLTGEIKHHEITDAVARGMVIFEAGHYASEALMIPALAAYLQGVRNPLLQENKYQGERP